MGVRLALAMLMAFAVAPARADTFTVSSTLDDVDATPGDGSCATASGACTLRAAVQEANAHAGADVITLPAGTFFLSLTGVNEDSAATGDLDVLESLQIDGAGRESTIIDGLQGDRILSAVTPISNLTVRDLTMRNGRVTGDGGAILIGFAPTVLERVRFEGNTSLGFGGAVEQVVGSLTVTDCVFDRNTAQAMVAPICGPAIGMGGGGDLTVTGSTFTHNRGIDGQTGAIEAQTSGKVTITSSTFSSNSAEESGGALLVFGASSLTLAGSTFTGNRSTNGVGTIIFSSGSANVTISDTKVLGGSGRLAAVSLHTSGTVVISGSEFSDNVSTAGGPALSLDPTAGATIENTVLRRNESGPSNGGGLFVASGGPITLTDVEATENSSKSGGGMYVGGTGTVALTRVRAVNNRTTNGQGGGVYVTGSQVAITDSTIDGNVGTLGGGLFASTDTLTISNTTLSNNRAVVTGEGGGAYIENSTAVVTLTNVTVSGNVADEGGGLNVEGTVAVNNATFADNAAGLGSALYVRGGTCTVGSSIVTGSAASHCAGMVTSGDFNVDSNGTCGIAGPNDRSNVDPQLGPLADNGGPTLTHLPAASSPAIDGGNPVGCPAADQRGQTRPTDGNGDGSAVCDAGAVEFLDLCPTDPAKTLPGICGCGVADIDAALPNGVADCLVNAELKARVARAKAIVAGLTGDPSETPVEAELTDIVNGLGAYVKQLAAQIVLADPKAKLDKLARKTKKPVRKVTKAKAGKKLDKAKAKATAALDRFDQAVAPQ